MTDCDSVCNAMVQSYALPSKMFDILCDFEMQKDQYTVIKQSNILLKQSEVKLWPAKGKFVEF